MIDSKAPQWRKSTYSGEPDIGTCVEAADLAPGIRGLRDSTDPGGPVIAVRTGGLAALLRSIRAGELDLA